MGERSLWVQRVVTAGGLSVALLATSMTGVAAAQRDGRKADTALARARTAYNQAQFDVAITAAQEARATPATAAAASIVLARSHLERFRTSRDASDLSAAREALRTLNPTSLAPRDRLEFVVGLGESLYLQELFGPAAELFETALSRASEIGPAARERMLDWWATALDRQAHGTATPGIRDALYVRILERMQDELSRDTGSAAASYWLAAAALGRGEVDRAWYAAVAGWVRAPLAGDQSARLRADLDRLVLQGIVPERLRQLPPSSRDSRQQAAFLGEWENIKKTW